jgi:hypothetical protein
MDTKELTKLSITKNIVQKSHLECRSFQFARKYDFEKRRETAHRVTEQSPGRIPVVIELSPNVHRELHQHLRDEQIPHERLQARADNSILDLALFARKRFFTKDLPSNAGVFLYSAGDTALGSATRMCSQCASVSSFTRRRSIDGWLYFLVTVEAAL